MITLTHLKPYVYPRDYIGQSWEGWYPVLGQHRDSDTITRSNYIVALKALQEIAGSGCGKCEDGGGPVTDTRCNHWAVGWVETIYVHQCDEAALKLADDMLGRIEDYPLLDEEHQSELEFNEAADWWEQASIRERVGIVQKAGLSGYAARHCYSDVLNLDPTGYKVSEQCSPDRC